MTSRNMKFFTKEELKEMDCPFPPEEGYEEDIRLKSAEEMRESQPKKLPRNIKVIRLGDRTIFAQYMLGSWKILSEEEVKKLCR